MTKKHKQGALPGADDEPATTTDEETSPEDDPPTSDLPFEEAVEELEKLVHDLEEGDLPLDEAMQRFERGLALVKTCQTKLKQAELKVSELMDDGSTRPSE